MTEKSFVRKVVNETTSNEDSLGFKIFFFVTMGLAPLCLIGGWIEAGLIAGLLIAAATSAAAFVLGFAINAVVEAYWEVRLKWRRKSS
ncbi:hypothetical protein BRC19_00640 [Candidatus Saccharibacteria bacterium QS_5_54_17]|nr:MAG: hypothetical protein BRC19_00640 [Candidatus Saccharibacteria bacterium QS_5_54_17]